MCLQMDSEQRSVEASVSVTLNVKGQIITLYNGKMPPTGRLQCYSFQVPPPAGGQDEVAEIQISGSGAVEFKESKSVLIRRINNGVVIQTDKPTYRPSQTVNFRIVTLDEKFVASKKPYPIVELRDSNNNRIAQWLEVQPNMGIIDLNFNLTSEPLLGSYTISVDNGKALKTFIVEEQVLPRFEVTIESPSEIYAPDPTFQLKVCGRYTYGKGVDGQFSVSMCREMAWYYMNGNNICSNADGETDVNGCFSATVNTTDFNLTEFGYFNFYIVMVASLVERGTGVKLEASRKVPVSYVLGTVRFEDVDTYYKVGYPFHAMLVALNRNGSPSKFQKASLQIQIADAVIEMEKLTDNMGQIHYNLDTSKWTGTVNLRAYVMKTPYNDARSELTSYYNEAYHTVRPYFSEARSSVKLEAVYGVISCGRQVNVNVTYELSKEDLRPNSNSVAFYYLVIGKGGILLFGQKPIPIGRSNPVKGVLTVPVVFTSDFAPGPKMIGYITLRDGMIIADRLKFKVEYCFRNKVNLKFPQEEALPKSQLNLRVEAAAGSLCALRAVDKSVQISYMDQELTAQKIYKLFPFSERSGYNYLVDELQSNPCWVFRSQTWKIPYQNNFVDILGLFRDISVKILTNLHIQKPLEEPEPCSLPMIGSVLEPVMLKESVVPEAPLIRGDSEEKIRKYFPETWIWKLVPVSKMGQADLKVTVPDTITEWSAGAFCTGPDSFGLSPAVSLRGFQPFFVELILPYSVVRGERFALKALVFNYLQQCIKIAVSLLPSQDVQVSKCLGCKTSSCACPDRAVAFEWDITPQRVGSVTLTVRADAINNSTETCEGKPVFKPTSGQTDIIRRQLLVKPGGVRKDITQTFFLCLKVQESFSLALPEVPVEDSVSAAISVMGDVLGSALQNLDRLIVAPYGCGEQNMLNFAPIIYVLQYLEATGQLMNELKTRATGYLQSGYQRQLTFKHMDGSFSAFGQSDGDGSSWLTAFVVKCFSQARSYIFIDSDVISRGVAWLSSLQEPGGCFTNKGKLFHTLMKGGVEDDVSLSAYITAALLEVGISENDIILANALNCVKGKVLGSTNRYTQALLAYTFSLTGDTATRQILLDKLYSAATTSGGQMFWEYKLLASSAVSANVELTSYILLALVSRPTVSSEEIQKASQIVKWLTKQQNPNGGFSSTQDTVVAIQALAKYSRATFNDQGSLCATVTGAKGFTKRFHVDKRNRLLQQTAALPLVPGKYYLLVNGSGCIYIQSVLKYNAYPKANNLAFNLRVEAHPFTCSNGTLTEFLLPMWVSYNGSRDFTNMVVIRVEMLSGYRAREDTIKLLLSFPLVKKVSLDLDSVTIYLDELKRSTEMFLLVISQTNVVQNLKPAVVKVYDYYTPEENTVASYIASC
ncbi:alpha-2-macroglobulin-like protein 1 [Spea bombifrons]|uniref:alpha-2-macroglobulin-like protein 1 n=1 Tax=Spea bombifrons TaxID=233779 RepID=UPI00234990FB|nr:alpha-2-macroglobulin-like protein 1 [Spea bombifrons]